MEGGGSWNTIIFKGMLTMEMKFWPKKKKKKKKKKKN